MSDFWFMVVPPLPGATQSAAGSRHGRGRGCRVSLDSEVLRRAGVAHSSVELTQLLLAHERGEAGAFDRLVAAVYEDLRRLARRELGRRFAQTLNPTGLVHECYLKLAEQSGVPWRDRGHFFSIAARAMRQVLVDHARRRLADKRGAGIHHTDLTDLDQVDVAVERDAAEVLAVEQALGRLGELDPVLVEVVECRYFAGLTEPETAEALGLSQRTVQRHWARARAWLKVELGG
jgi:RNA polymerase sigma factor (TIGR02999 family)